MDILIAMENRQCRLVQSDIAGGEFYRVCGAVTRLLY
jgi:hypothetical protein